MPPRVAVHAQVVDAVGLIATDGLGSQIHRALGILVVVEVDGIGHFALHIGNDLCGENRDDLRIVGVATTAA